MQSLESIAQHLCQEDGTVKLSEEEKALLIWSEGDFIDIVAGHLTVTEVSTFDHPNAKMPYIKFFFERADLPGKTHDLRLFTSTQIKNGPALLVRYCRPAEDKTFVFNALALISAVDGGWTYTDRIERLSLVYPTERFKALILKQVDLGAAEMGSDLLFKLGIRKTPRKSLLGRAIVLPALKKGEVVLRRDNSTAAIYQTLKHLIFRLARSGEKLLEGKPSDGGKL